ncbi:retention module-containing protein, partial [Catenovulum sp. 2E275]|uniref:retention module-containing protein n=1 Tax=Catenovulum sp. 2E275 TaxID=2980497 RepID=UPI0021CF69BE
MSQVIAVVLDFEGECYIRAANGDLKQVQVGDSLVEGDTLITYQNASVQISLGEDLVTVPANQIIEITANLSSGAIIERLDSQLNESSVEETFNWLNEVAQREQNNIETENSESNINPDTDFDEFLTALSSDGDILANLEATAAGNQAAGGGGVSFVRLVRIAGSEEPLSFSYNADSNDSFSANDGSDNTTTSLVENDLGFTINPIGEINTQTPIISGNSTAQPGSTVVINITDSNNQTQTLTTQVTADGSWSVGVESELSEGTFNVSGSIESNGLSINSQGSDSGIIDITPPNLSVNEIGVTNNPTPVFSGTTDLTAGSIVSITLTQGETVIQTLSAEVDGDGNWSSVPDTITDGTFDFIVTASDTAGNISQQVGTGEIDTITPQLSIDPLGISDDATPLISGQSDVTEGALITILITDNANFVQTLTTTVSDGNWQVEVPIELAQGDYTVVANVEDAAGNTASVTTEGVINLNLPEIIINPVPVSNDTTPSISGTTNAPEGTSISVVITDSNNELQQIDTQVNESGNWQVEVNNALSEGEFEIEVSVIFNGLSSTETIIGEIDITAPSLTVNEIGESSNNQPEISGFTDAQVGSAVEIVVTDSSGVAQNLTALVTGDGSWSVQIPDALPEGEADIS